MSTTKTRVRGRTSPHGGRSIRTRGRKAGLRHSTQRRGRYDRRDDAQPSFGKVVTVATLIAALAATAYLLGILQNVGETNGIARQIIYTAPTANDAEITLPDVVRKDLHQIAQAHQRIALTRGDSTGEISTTVIDMTPRTGDSPKDPVLKVSDRATPVIDAKISGLEKRINSSTATTGDRALYNALTKIDFTGAPVTIISTGLDLADPVNFRDLNWSVPAQKVVANVKRSGALPAMHGPVTFVIVPSAGAQPQLSQAQKTYRNTIWTALLAAGGASSVTFIDADGIAASSGPSAPTVAVPELPDTPIPPVRRPAKKTVTCTVPATYFVVNTATLIDVGKTKRELTTCVKDALAAGATFALDGWTSYDGPLKANGKPAVDKPGNRKLSNARVRTIANLLVNEMGVPRSAIARMTGHGNVDQPHPDPRSPANRVVVITYTTI
jgi:hypothetical protein